MDSKSKDIALVGGLFGPPVICDFTTLRMRVWAESVEAYGPATGGGWIGPSCAEDGCISLAATSNLFALLAHSGHIPDDLYRELDDDLRKIHIKLKGAISRGRRFP